MTLIQDINMLDFLIDGDGVSEQKDDIISSLWKSNSNYLSPSLYPEDFQDLVPAVPENNTWDDIMSCLNSEELPAPSNFEFDLLSEVCESDGSSDLNAMSPSGSDDSGITCTDAQEVVKKNCENKEVPAELVNRLDGDVYDRLKQVLEETGLPEVKVEEDEDVKIETVNNKTLDNKQSTDIKQIIIPNNKSVVTKIFKVASTQPLVLPINSIKGIKAIKVINNNSSSSTVKTETVTPNKHKYPQLKLTEEEKRLMKKEGIILPDYYPLTREEEKDLKRIRRKIRNKISAQDSRKRKKEYLDGLEDRMKRCSAENLALKQRVKQLESKNETLVGQLRKLQQIVVNATNTTHTSTAMLVLLLSFCLILLPNLRPGTKDNRLQQVQHFINTNTIPGRTLLSNALMGDMSKQCNPNDMPIKEEEPTTEQETNTTAPLKREWGDHDYLEPPNKLPRIKRSRIQEIREDTEIDWKFMQENKDEINLILDGTWDLPIEDDSNKTKRVVSVAYNK